MSETFSSLSVSNKSTNKLFGKFAQKIALFFSLILLCIVFSFCSPYFLKIDNIMTIILQTSVIGIIAIGVTYIIITGGIDLSLGAVLAIGGMMIGVGAKMHLPLALCILLGLMVAILFGVINGVLIAFAKLPPFIATLGMMMVARGLTLVISGARPMYFLEFPGFKKISQAQLLDTIPFPVFYLFIIAIISDILLKKFAIGRYVYAIGSNEHAARLSGIKVERIKLFVYSFSGFMCGIAGVVLTSRLNSAQPMAGSSYELNAIAAAVIGGTSLAGGEGTIIGTIIGALIMGVLQNGLNLMNVSQFWQQVVMGLVVILAVYIDTLRKK